MNIAIVSENRFEQKTLDDYISSWAQKNGICVDPIFFGSEKNFTMRVLIQAFDIVFLNIAANGQNSIETARNLRKYNINTLLIIIAANSDYMAQAFSLHAFEYIIKPYSEKRIAQILDDAGRLFGNIDKVTELAGEKFLLSDILYVYSDSNYCEVHCKNEKRRIRLSFKELADKLTRYKSFMIVSRGAVVNFDNTLNIADSYCVISNGDRVPVSRSKSKEVEQRYADRQFNQKLSEIKK